MRTQNPQLLELLGRRFPDMSAADIAHMTEIILGMIVDATAADKGAEIRGFGVFYSGKMNRRLMRNPGSGEMMELPARKRPRFRASRHLRHLANRTSDSA